PDALWFPPLIETLIATSIVYMALENIVFAAEEQPQSTQRSQSRVFSAELHPNDGSSTERKISAVSASSAVALRAGALKRRWLVTFAFGLVHGFGFSFALRQTLQFAGSHLLTSLLSFNIGVELGQLLVLVLLIPMLHVFFRFAVAERTGTIILSALIAHTGWHWMLD